MTDETPKDFGPGKIKVHTDGGQIELQLDPVYIANISPGTVNTHFSQSLQELRGADILNGWFALQGVINGFSGAQISKARNDAAAEFLRLADGPDGAEWLLFLDSDMVFPPDLLPKLQVAAHLSGADIIGGLCVMVGPLGAVPTLYQWDRVPGSTGYTRVMLEYPERTLLQVTATGTACLMIRKSVLKAMRDRIGHDLGWFMEAVAKTQVPDSDRFVPHWISEDVNFCVRAAEMVPGLKIVVDTSMKIGHAKNGRIWTADDVGKRTHIERPPIVAVIPMKDKIGLTQTLVDQLYHSRVSEIIVVDNGSTDGVDMLDQWEESVVEDTPTVMRMPDAGIHTMWNRAVEYALARHGERVHIALLNNDLEVCPDFLPIMSAALSEHQDFMAVSGNYDRRRAPFGTRYMHERWVATYAAIQDTGTDICGERYDGTGGFAGFAMMIRGEYFAGGYRFPEDLRWWCGDSDLLMSLMHTRMMHQVDGYKAGIVLAALCEHVDSTGRGPGGGSVGGGRAADKQGWADPANAQRLRDIQADMAVYSAKWQPFWDFMSERSRGGEAPDA